jgi:hypothetical protein
MSTSAEGILCPNDQKRTHDEVHFKKNTVSAMTEASAKEDWISPADVDAKKQKTKSTTNKKDAFAIMMQSAKKTLEFDLLKAEGHVHDWDALVSQEEVDQASTRTQIAAIRLSDSLSGYDGNIYPFNDDGLVWMNEDSEQMANFDQELQHAAEFPQDPMPPPTTEPSAKAYLKEIRVHFAPNKGDDTTKFVQGFTLRYSDGVQKVIGNIRGTKSPGSIELDPDEHLVGIDQKLDCRGGRTVAVHFYISHWSVDYFVMEVSSDHIEREYHNIWLHGSAFQSKTGHVIKSFEFSETEQKITGIQGQKKPMTKNEPYEGRPHEFVDSLSYEDAGEAGDRPFSQMEKFRPKRGPRNIAEYLYLVPLKARPALKKLQQEFREEAWDLLFRKMSTYDWFEQNYRGPWQKIRDQAGKLLVVSPEARNIKTLENVITKIQYREVRHFTEKDKSRVSDLILKEQTNLLETRIPLISAQVRRRTDEMEATLIQDFRDFLKHKRVQKWALVESFLSRLTQFSTKHKIQRRLQVCYQPYCWNVFDPSLVPEWKRCTADGSVGGASPHRCADYRQTCGSCMAGVVYPVNSHDYYCEEHNCEYECSL